MGTPATIQFDSRFEYGLKLPDGKVLWPPTPFYGTGYQTPEERAAISIAIQDAIKNMNLPMGPTLDQYKWLKREFQTITVERELVTEAHDIDDPLTVAEMVDAEVVPEVYEPKGFVQDLPPGAFEDQQYQ